MTVAPVDVWIAFGSNLGDRRANLRRALELLGADCELVAASPLYSTEPVGYAEQGWFLNAVAKMRTRLTAEELLTNLHRIEAELGRERRIRNGPRTVDLDILLYGDKTIARPGLNVPHPRAHERLFVVAPWSDLAPGLQLPAAGGRSLAQLRHELEGSAAVERYADPPW